MFNFFYQQETWQALTVLRSRLNWNAARKQNYLSFVRKRGSNRCKGMVRPGSNNHKIEEMIAQG